MSLSNKFVESDHELESLKNSIDGLRKMLQTVDNISAKQQVSNYNIINISTF